MDSIQSQNHELNLTTILSLKSTAKLWMLVFTEIIYSLRYNTLITEKLRCAADHNNNFELTMA